mgnify:FL=1
MPDPQEYTYDIFISYAREDYAWVSSELHTPLTQCVRADGRAPRVFLDQSDVGVGIGQDFTEALAKAISNSHRIILVYSSLYFSKDMTLWELTRALMLDPTGQQGRIIPILLEPQAIKQIPLKINHINYLNVQESTWLLRLQAYLNLKTGGAPRDMAFGAPVPDVVVNNTLPPVTVLLSDRGKPGALDEIVEIEATEGGLQGTLRRKSHEGIAVFADLSFRIPTDNASLTAKVLGYRDAVSNTFAVKKLRAAATHNKPGDEKVTIPATELSRVLIFGDGQGCAVVTPGATVGKAAVYGRDGFMLGKEVTVSAHPRLFKTAGQLAAVVDWKGDVLQLHSDGSSALVSLRPKDVTFAVPGHLAYDTSGLLVGMWNGDLYRVDGKGHITCVLQHPYSTGTG